MTAHRHLRSSQPVEFEQTLRPIERIEQTHQLLLPDTQVLVLRRDTQQDLQPLPQVFRPSAPAEFQYLGPSGGLGAQLAQILSLTDPTRSSSKAWLYQDILHLAEQFAQIWHSDEVKVRLERVSDDACRRFHADNVVTRLICTYAGPGTQFVHTDSSQEEDEIWHAPTGAALILKGKQWPGETPCELLHRSPPIEALGIERLLLVIEPAAPRFEAFERQAHALQNRAHPGVEYVCA